MRALLVASALAVAALAAPVQGADERVPASRSEPDVVLLKDGRTVQCRVLREAQHRVHVLRRGERSSLRRSDIVEVRSVERSVRSLLERLDALSEATAPRLTPLALFAEHAGLEGEARALWLRVLFDDPANARAWGKVGGVRGPAGWKLPDQGRRITLEELRKEEPAWRGAHELVTAHFVLRTNHTLEVAHELALHLERRYVAFAARLADPLELDASTEALRVHVHRVAEEYPTSPEPGRSAWFDAPSRTVFVQSAGEALDSRGRRDLDLQLARALLSNGYVRRLDQSTALPPWLDRGLAEWFAASLAADGSDQVLAARHAIDPEPLSLTRLVASSESDFVQGEASGRFAAQAFTLVDLILMRGEEGSRERTRSRSALAAYARDAVEGKSTPAHLLDSLELEESALTPLWLDHARRLGGR